MSIEMMYLNGEIKRLEDELNKLYKTRNEIMLKVIQVDSNLYHKNLERLDSDYRPFLYPHFTADKFYLVFEGDAVGGFTVNKSGVIEGLFTLKKGIGARVFNKQIELTKEIMTGDRLRLFCATDFLKDYYLEKGFMIDRISEFDDKLAADGWNYKRFGRPNFYDMSRGV